MRTLKMQTQGLTNICMTVTKPKVRTVQSHCTPAVGQHRGQVAQALAGTHRESFPQRQPLASRDVQLLASALQVVLHPPQITSLTGLT